MKKEIFYVLAKSAFIVCMCACIGLFTLIISFLIPTANLAEKMESTVKLFKEEGEHPYIIPGCNSRLDNYTDSIMILSSVYNGKENILDKTLLIFRENAVEDGKILSPLESLIMHFDDEFYDDNIEWSTTTYSRYWHGYITILRPVLLLLGYPVFRVLNLIIQSILSITVIILLLKKSLKQLMIPYILTVAMLNPIVLGNSLQYSWVFYIFSVASIVLLSCYDKWNEKYNWCYFFLIVGIATSYFDLLTYPLVTLGIPLIIFVSGNKQYGLKDRLNKILSSLIFWCLGYGAMWACKWIIASLFTKENVILSAIQQVLTRSSTTNAYGEHVSLESVISRNWTNFVDNPIFFIVLGFVAVFGLLVIIKDKKGVMENIIIYGAIAILPFIWYVIVANHSFIHSYFTCKSLAVSVFAITTLVVLNKNQQQYVDKSKIS